MDTNKLKRFATEARNKIRQGVVHKLLTLGFNARGEADEFPRKLQGSTLFRGQQLEESFYDQWIALYQAIQKHGLKAVYEEVAYTWFNRFVAIRILQMNGFIDRVLVFDNPDIRVPHIVTEARQGRFPVLTTSEQLRLRNIITDPTKTYEQFVILITAFCHATPILNRCFGSINDYTELLLPNDVLEEGGFVDMLNHTEFITETDYKTTELLGWLYQFYISERKDEVFAAFKKGQKAEAEDIAPATQIFTPNWIVKYMVENTLGRIYLDNNPGSALEEQMPYLVAKAEGTEEAIYRYEQLEDLRVIDPACGSGHILLEAFDLLYAMYLDEFYSREEAIKAIFAHNLVGIDLDTRARQLATFALLLKACQRDDRFLDAHCLPRVLDMPAGNRDTWRDTLGHFDCYYGLTSSQSPCEEIDAAFQLLEQAPILGSTMKFAISERTRVYLQERVACYEAKPQCSQDFELLVQGFRLILALTDRYAAVIANPPYMGSGNMNKVLSDYVKKNYAEGKGDLAMVFMQVAESLLAKKGKYGMINLPSWLFLSSFEILRKNLIKNCQIDSLLHMGRGIFAIDWGSVAFIISKHSPCLNGSFFRLHERNFQHLYYNHIGQLFKKVLNNHSFKYDFSTYRDEDVSNITDFDFKYAENGLKLYFKTNQKNFEKIPGSPIGYWVSENIIKAMSQNIIGNNYKVIAGLCTGDNARYIYNWFEPNKKDIVFPFESISDKKFKFHNKGGEARKWYGNQDLIVKYNSDSLKELQTLPGFRNDGNEYFFKESISWAKITSSYNTFRYYPKGFIFDSAGSSIFSVNNGKISLTLLGFCNSILSRTLISIINPTINASPGIIRKLPLPNNKEIIEKIVCQNISISRSDWDAHETSWDFQRNELLTIDAETYADNIQYQIEKHEKETGEKICIDPAAPELGSLAWRMEQYKLKWEKLFMQLHANEEELNRQFIDIYGLQDELTPDVPLDEVTILQQGEISIE